MNRPARGGPALLPTAAPDGREQPGGMAEPWPLLLLRRTVRHVPQMPREGPGDGVGRYFRRYLVIIGVWFSDRVAIHSSAGSGGGKEGAEGEYSYLA